jgi:hypothetical protein
MRRAQTTVVSLLLLVAPPAAAATDPQFEVQIKKAFMAEFKDRTSIDAKMLVRHSHKQPNDVGEKSADGDLHFSGESKDVGLPFVAEVVNGWQQDAAVTFIKKTAKNNEDHPNATTMIDVVGAWRLWFEHPSTSQIQGGNNPFYPDHTNPDHSFEIHPVATVGTIDVHDSFGPVWDKKVHPPQSFVAYPPELAFPYFDKIGVLIKASNTGVSIRSKKLKYNYVQFVMELTQKPKGVTDGYIALARVSDGDGETESNEERRMIFVEGTEGAKTMKTAAAGDRFHVLGIPRVNLNAVSFLVEKNGTKQFSAKLPYEMIIVGIYPD